VRTQDFDTAIESTGGGTVERHAMTGQAEKSGSRVWRVLENAGILTFASLLAMSLLMQRYAVALVWFGALLVFFAQAWEARLRPPADFRLLTPLGDLLGWLRRIGIGVSLIGVTTLIV
jgi:hypothetical protein